MEDTRQRLQFDDVIINSRCVEKLVQAVKRKSRGLIASSTPPIQELNFLFDLLTDETVNVGGLILKGIFHLISNNHLDTQFALNKLLSILPSASSNAYSITKVISKIAAHDYTKLGGNASPYSMYQPKHPLIAVLQLNEDYFPLILESITDALALDVHRGFQAMEPVISYIFYDPSHGSRFSKLLLLDALSDVMKEETLFAFYILRCIPFLQVTTRIQVIEACNFIKKAIHHFQNTECEEIQKNYITELLLLCTLSQVERCLQFDVQPERLLSIAEKLASTLAATDSSSAYCNVFLVLIAMLMKSATGIILMKITTVALQVLQMKPISPSTSSFLASSIVRLLASPSTMVFEDFKISQLSQLLQKLECLFLQESTSSNASVETSSNSELQKEISCVKSFTLTVESSQMCAKFAVKMDQCDLTEKSNWLKTIKNSMETSSLGYSDVLFSLVSAMLLMAPEDHNYLSLCLETLESVLQKYPVLSTRVFALLLYKQNLLKLPISKFLILTFLPKLAVHKYAIPPAISVFTAMFQEKKLKAQAVNLMLQLWKKHDRCFSFLHKLLIDRSDIPRSGHPNETLVSQVAAIREICTLAPDKHGSDFLGILSNIFNDPNDDASTPIACLALDGVISLCKTEFIDLRSTWKMLGPKLTKDKRTLVISRMYKLLSLVPELKVKSPEYDKFESDIVALIWKQCSSVLVHPDVLCAAYKALAKFDKEYHTLKQLPLAAKSNLKLPMSLKATPFDMGKLPEDVLTFIPGYCYMDLMASMKTNSTIEGYIVFLNAMIKQEVAELPRSVYTQSTSSKKNLNTNEMLAKVPKFLCTHFEARKSPGLQKNLAVGVLLSYEPPIEYGKDGEPIKRSIASQSRFYEQVLGVLLNEVNVDSSEWQRSILLSPAWSSFMERMFFCCEESRKAELELQRSLGHSNSTPEEFSTQCKLAWLWVRNRILDLIKHSVKNATSSHANCILAVAGLVRAVNKFYCSLDENIKSLSDGDQTFVPHQKFVADCSETILCSMMPDYKHSGEVHIWLLTHLSRPNSSASFLVQGCSSSSVCHFASHLMTCHVDKIPNIFNCLLSSISHTSPVLSFYSSVGLGFLIRSLCEIGYADIGESQVEIILHITKEIITIYNENENKRSNALVSLTFIITSLSQLPQEDFKDFVSTCFSVFHEHLINEETSSMHFELLSICVTAMLIGAVDGNCVAMDLAQNLSNWFEEKQSEFPQCSGVSSSLGMMLDYLSACKSSRGAEMKSKFQKEWFNLVSSDKKPTLHRIAALNGLCSLYSHGKGLLSVKSSEDSDDSSSVNSIVSVMFQMLTSSRDNGMLGICSWEVGRLYAVHSFKQETESSVPASYSYLNEKSILKPLIKTLLDSHESETSSLSPSHLHAALKTIEGTFPRPLPPLNWSSLLLPFLQLKNSEVLETVLNISICQAQTSPTAASVLSLYCCPPLIHTLPENCFAFLVQHIPELGVCLPTAKLQIFLQTVISVTIKQDKDFKKYENITLEGISNALTQPGLKQQSSGIFRDAFLTIFKHYKKDFFLIRTYLSWISRVLSKLPKKTVERLLTIPRDTSDISILIAVWCFLVRTGQRKLADLRPCIDEGKHSDLKEKGQIYLSVYECFLHGSQASESEVSSKGKCVSFLLESIGWINTLDDPKSQYQLMGTREVFVYMNDVCFATLMGCAGIECSYNIVTAHTLSHMQLLENLPMVIASLSKTEVWQNTCDKIINWLLSLLRSSHFQDEEKLYIKQSLCALKHTDHFHKIEVWTDVTSNVC